MSARRTNAPAAHEIAVQSRHVGQGVRASDLQPSGYDVAVFFPVGRHNGRHL